MRPSSRRRAAAWLLALPAGSGGERCARRGRLEMISFWLLCWKLLRATAGLRRNAGELTDGNQDDGNQDDENQDNGYPSNSLAVNGSPPPTNSSEPVAMETMASSPPPTPETETHTLIGCWHPDAEELHFPEGGGAQEMMSDEKEGGREGEGEGEKGEEEEVQQPCWGGARTREMILAMVTLATPIIWSSPLTNVILAIAVNLVMVSLATVVPLATAVTLATVVSLAMAVNLATVTILTVTLATVTLATVTLATVTLATVTLAMKPLVTAVPLTMAPLATVTLATVPLATVPLATVPLATVSLATVTLGTVTLATVTLATVTLMTVTLAMVTLATVTLEMAFTLEMVPLVSVTKQS
ncbi:unnamed protein product [Arctogadus glacialis]